MKGISTILAMILIVIIVVALIGLTYTFAVGLFGTTTEATTETTHEVKITGFTFTPQSLTINPGDSVVWNNMDPIIHFLWFVFVANGSTYLLSPPIIPDTTWSHTFNEPIELQYYSFENLWMTGFINVIPEVHFELHLSAGWNMVSFPCLPEDASFSNIFSEVAFYQVLTWDGTSYVTPTTAEAGWGYWVLVLTGTTVIITCDNLVESYERDLPAGWSMIGSIIICTVDADCVFPSFYQLLTWDGASYVPSAVIAPGKGYWALVLESTQIVVDSSCCV